MVLKTVPGVVVLNMSDCTRDTPTVSRRHPLRARRPSLDAVARHLSRSLDTFATRRHQRAATLPISAPLEARHAPTALWGSTVGARSVERPRQLVDKISISSPTSPMLKPPHGVARPGHLEAALEQMVTGDLSAAQVRLRFALRETPALLPAWDLTLRCIDELLSEADMAGALSNVAVLACALQAAACTADAPTWAQLIKRFDKVRRGDHSHLAASRTPEMVLRLRLMCEADWFLCLACTAAREGDLESAAGWAYQAFERDPLNPEAFRLLSQYGTTHVHTSLYEDALSL